MQYNRPERTLAKPCQVSGRGYWSGQQLTVCCEPANPGEGIVFVRTDLSGTPSVAAKVNQRESMSLRTVLRSDAGAVVSMVEHLMAALFACQIDNARVLVDAEEMPGLDGSALGYVDAIKAAGAVEQSTSTEPLLIDRVLRIGTAASWIEASPCDSGCLEVEYQLDYGPRCPIRAQTASCVVTPESFAAELAAARTFVTEEQVQQLIANGVGKHVTTKDLLIFNQDGLVDNKLHFENECARHKALDMVGDLALAGFPVIGRFVSHRGGHELNAAMAGQLQKLYRRSSRRLGKTA